MDATKARKIAEAVNMQLYDILNKIESAAFEGKFYIDWIPSLSEEMTMILTNKKFNVRGYENDPGITRIEW